MHGCFRFFDDDLPLAFKLEERLPIDALLSLIDCVIDEAESRLVRNDDLSCFSKVPELLMSRLDKDWKNKELFCQTGRRTGKHLLFVFEDFHQSMPDVYHGTCLSWIHWQVRLMMVEENSCLILVLKVATCSCDDVNPMHRPISRWPTVFRMRTTHFLEGQASVHVSRFDDGEAEK